MLEEPAAYRAALIGCGRIGSELADDPMMAGDVFTHAEAYSVCPRTKLVAVCDFDSGRVERCGDRWGVEGRYSDPVEMMREQRPEIVSICTPTHTHFDVARQVLIHGDGLRGVLCEKPLTASLTEADELVDLARDRNVTLAVVYMRRYANNFKSARDLIASGGIGTIQAVSGWYPFGTLHSGSHWFDMLRMLVGEVAWVSAVDLLKEAGEDPTLEIALGLANGAVASLRALDVRNFVLFEMDIIGSEGRVRITDNGYRMDLYRAGPSQRTAGYVNLHELEHDFGDRRDLMLHAVEDLVQALDTGSSPACTAMDGIEALRIGLAAFESARRGCVVEIDGPERPS